MPGTGRERADAALCVPGGARPEPAELLAGQEHAHRLREKRRRDRQAIQGPAGTPRFVVVSPDGSRLAATAFDPQSRVHHLQVCDVGSGERRFLAEGWALAYSPDGRWLAVRDADEKAVLLPDARPIMVKNHVRGQSVVPAGLRAAVPVSRRRVFAGE